MDMEGVLELVQEDLRRVELQFEENLRSDVPLIATIGRHILNSGGKRIRPILTLLSARLCGYSGDRAIPLASIVEFIHTATLLHDDVVDSANLRRGQQSANALWGNSASVLVGDFLFTKSFSLMVANGDLGILRAMSDATTRMAEGEVLQLINTCDLEISEEQYLDVVINKTAVLIATACEIGGLLGAASPDQLDALRRYGMEVGIAFQLMDDCLDYVSDRESFGKAVGSDLEEGKITLPLIHAVRCCTQTERGVVQSVVDRETLARTDLEKVLELIRKYEGIEFTKRQARGRVKKAKAHLSVFERAPEREALTVVADYVVSRAK